ncbi:hypothetical protein NQ038_06800 [Brevibacterium sp. 50QC2O2]|uniref:hypothetical protein n=1 Tax=Brevibacterium sp. 50QC2O2 TaxID=2968459 RepID=UPI00211C5D8E|nr:hypothetical protein [Brevibacterium sp. 50QC2O2]MCQ9388355.1 hypothetical protein [Brevibacterium sp. 50QC2O2]
MGQGNETADLTEVIATRRARRARPWWITGTVLVVVLGCGLLGWFTPALALQSVTVTGASLTDAGAVEQAVLQDHRGTPLPRLRLGAISAQLHERFPKTSEVRLRWSGPRSLTVVIVDRQPALAVAQGKRWQRFDESGNAIDTVNRKPELPLLQAEGTAPAESVRSAVELITGLDDAAAQRVRTIRTDRSGTLSIVYAATGEELADRSTSATASAAPSATQTQRAQPGRDVTIVFGTSADVQRKFRIARALLPTGAQRIDVSLPERPVTG